MWFRLELPNRFPQSVFSFIYRLLSCPPPVFTLLANVTLAKTSVTSVADRTRERRTMVTYWFIYLRDWLNIFTQTVG